MMLAQEQLRFYKAFGLRIASAIPLPELIEDELTDTSYDVEIRVSDLTAVWREYGNPDDYYAYRQDQVLFHVPYTADYSIERGCVIRVSPMEGADHTRIRLYLLGTCMGALLLQRNMLPLHGSAVLINGKAFAIMGDSGAGKSTLAASLLRKGCSLLSDDLIAVSLSEENRTPVIVPAYPQQKLWQESMEQLGVTTEDCVPLYETKYGIPVGDAFCSQPVPLGGVFELYKSERDEVLVRPIEGLERLHVLQCHTYRNFLIPHMGLAQWHLSTSATMVPQIPMIQLQRPSQGFTVEELAQHIMDAAS